MATLREVWRKFGGVLRASRMLRAATQMIAVRDKIKPWLHRIGRIGDMCVHPTAIIDRASVNRTSVHLKGGCGEKILGLHARSRFDLQS